MKTKTIYISRGLTVKHSQFDTIQISQEGAECSAGVSINRGIAREVAEAILKATAPKKQGARK